MSDLPHGWAQTRLGMLGRYINGRGFKSSEWSTSGRPIIRIQNLTGSSSTLNYYDGEIEQRHIVEPGDLLISWAATLGAYFWPGPQAVLNQHIFRVESYINRRFHKYLVDYVLRELMGKTHGSGMVHITRKPFDDTPVLLPPLAEQGRIVAAIEEQFSRLDAGVAALEQARQKLKQMRAAVLQAAATGHLLNQDPAEGTGSDLLARIGKERGGARPPVAASADLAVPKTWAVASLEAVTDPRRVICYGILKPKVPESGTVPYVEVKDLRARSLNVTALHRTSAALHREFSRSVLNSGDVVLAIRGSYDRALVVPPEVAGANMSRDVARIAPLQGIDASFLAAYLMSPSALHYLHERARGVAVKGVNIADLRSMPMPVPPEAEQKRIVGEIDRVNSIIWELESLLGSEQEKGTALRSSILAAALSGKLVAQDPADEPASVLLERATAESAAYNGHKRGRGRKLRELDEKEAMA